MEYRAAVLYPAAMIVVSAPLGAAGAQEIPESSLSDLFSVADHEAVWLAGAGSEGLPRLVSPLPGHGTPPASEDRNAGVVIALTTIGTVAGDLTSLYLFGGCVFSWCDSDEDELLSFVGIGMAVVGGAAGGAILGGGDPAKSILGSVGGIFGGMMVGGVAGGVVGAGAGLAAFLVTHAGVTALAALN